MCRWMIGPAPTPAELICGHNWCDSLSLVAPFGPLPEGFTGLAGPSRSRAEWTQVIAPSPTGTRRKPRGNRASGGFRYTI